MTRPTIGIALGSGSARGWSHIGILRELEAIGIHPDVVCGSSVGALVGASYLTGNLDSLEEQVRGQRARDLFRLLDISFDRGGFLNGDRLVEMVHANIDDVAIESLSKPFAAVATELDTGREVWLQKGSLSEAVRASISFPGLFTPFETGDGRRLVDGGLVNPVPASVCRALGAEVVIAVNLNADLIGRAAPRRRAAASAPAASGRRSADASEAAEAEVSSARDTGERSERDADNSGNLSNGGGGGNGDNARDDRRMSELWDALVARFSDISKSRRRKDDSPSFIDVLAASVHIMQDRITRSRMAGDPPDVVLMPRVGDIRLLDYDRGAEAIEAGRTSVRLMRTALERAAERTPGGA